MRGMSNLTAALLHHDAAAPWARPVARLAALVVTWGLIVVGLAGSVGNALPAAP